ncbi:MAG: enoyl-CoA hydratase/isomerase family protein, partial [Comamonadaceae bacterium]
MTDLVLRSDAGGVCTLTLNRPEKHNALDTRMFVQLEAHLAMLEKDIESIGCVVVRGAGKSFCAGADLAAMKEGVVVPSPMYKTTVIERLASLPQPVIAAVHGHCFTGGLELALAADFILAADSATFADTHGKWGLVAGWGMTQRLPRRIGTAQA